MAGRAGNIHQTWLDSRETTMRLRLSFVGLLAVAFYPAVERGALLQDIADAL